MTLILIQACVLCMHVIGGLAQGDIQLPTELAAPTMSLFLNEAYGNRVEQNTTIPRGISRFHFEVRAVEEQDLFGLDYCIASPSDSTANPSAHEFLQDSCVTGMLDFQMQFFETGLVHFSTHAFKFAGARSVYISCRVSRCAEEETCGTCAQADGARRLQSISSNTVSGEKGTPVATSLISFRLDSLNPELVVLPGFVPFDSMEPAFTPVIPPESAPASFEVNLTLYGCPMLDSVEELMDVVANVVAEWSRVPRSSVHIVGSFILMTSTDARRLSSDLVLAEVLIVKLEIAVSTTEAEQQVRGHFERAFAGDARDFSAMLAEKLENQTQVYLPGMSAQWSMPRTISVPPNEQLANSTTPAAGIGAAPLQSGPATDSVAVIAVLLAFVVCGPFGTLSCIVLNHRPHRSAAVVAFNDREDLASVGPRSAGLKDVRPDMEAALPRKA